VEGTTRAGVLSSHASPERRGGEALQWRPRVTGVRQAASGRGTVDRGNQAGRSWTGVVVGMRLSGRSLSSRRSARASRCSGLQAAAVG
jgi:hypothetical protein